MARKSAAEWVGRWDNLLLFLGCICSRIPEIKVQLTLNPVYYRLLNTIKDQYESNDKATFGVVKETNTHEAVKHRSDKPRFEFCIIIYWLYDPKKIS